MQHLLLICINWDFLGKSGIFEKIWDFGNFRENPRFSKKNSEKSAESLSHLMNFGEPKGLMMASKNAGINSSAVLDLMGLS